MSSPSKRPKMFNNYLESKDYKIPSFEQAPAYSFDDPDLNLFRELNELSEEISRCRGQLTEA